MEITKKSLLFNASCTALVVMALTFATRAMVLIGHIVDLIGMKRVIYIALKNVKQKRI